MPFIFAGNWKMNPPSATDAKNLFNSYKKLAQKFGRKGIQMIVAPSTPHVGMFFGVKLPKNMRIAAQDSFYEQSGAFTGSTSPLQVFGLGVDYVILGHSEKRALGDTNFVVSRKIQTALKVKLTPIVCIGEENRDLEGEFWHGLRDQIEESLSGVSSKDIGKVIIAYEPVWAVGEQALGSMHPNELHGTVLFIRKTISHIYGGKIGKSIKIIYGGSVFPEISRDLYKMGNVDGFLVGRESLDKKEVEKILNEVSK